MNEKNCLFCTSFYFIDGSHDREWNSGYNAEIGCEKGHWDNDYYLAESQLRTYMTSARSCVDYRQRDD
jgi:hypothetical protein